MRILCRIIIVIVIISTFIIEKYVNIEYSLHVIKYRLITSTALVHNMR